MFMKAINFILLISASVYFHYSHSQNLSPNESSALIKVLVTDMKNNPSRGDKIIFQGIKTGKVIDGISGNDGRFSVLLPKGDTYKIRCKSFEGEDLYNTIEIPAEEGLFSAEMQIMYELPKTYTLDNVYFDSGKSTLKTESYKSLNNLAELMVYKKSLKIEISGHTDDVGDDHANHILSESRAKSVRDYIIKRGIASERVVAVGYGEEQPIADNSFEEGRKKNRRTEVRILSE